MRDTIERGAPRGAAVNFTYNPDWQLENGVSVLARARTASAIAASRC